MEPTTATFEVLEVENQGNYREWSPQKGPAAGSKFHSYRLRVKNTATGEEATNVELNQKPETPAPKAGDSWEATFDPRPESEYGPRIKKVQQGGGGGGGGYKKSPEEQARIQRQHSQEMAVRTAAAAGWLAGVDADDAEVLGSVLNGPIKRATDYFDRDIRRGAAVMLAEDQSEQKDREQQSKPEPNQGGTDGSADPGPEYDG